MICVFIQRQQCCVPLELLSGRVGPTNLCVLMTCLIRSLFLRGNSDSDEKPDNGYIALEHKTRSRETMMRATLLACLVLLIAPQSHTETGGAYTKAECDGWIDTLASFDSDASGGYVDC